MDAYERKLVKQIEVASATVEDAHNRPFVRLLSVSNKRGVISASIEVDRASRSGTVHREAITVQDGFDLEQETGRPIYADFRIGEISTAKGEEFVELRYPGGETFLKIGHAHGDVDPMAVQREELTGYLSNMLRDATKSVYEHVVYDSTVERDFADELEKNDAVTLYAKLPGWFKVPTPLGNYNPDWAVLVEDDGTQRLYFVVETKSSLFKDDLRSKEGAKIACGEEHFRTLAQGEHPARYVVARSLGDLLAGI